MQSSSFAAGAKPRHEGVPLFQEYVSRYFQVPAVRDWLLQRHQRPLKYASSLRASMSYACMYFPPSNISRSSPYAPAPAFLDHGDVLLYHNVHGTIAVGNLHNAGETHALGRLRDSMRAFPNRLSNKPRARNFAADLSAPALEIIEFAWMTDDSLIIACRKLKTPPGGPTPAQEHILVADLLFYDVIPPNEFPKTPLIRMTLNERPCVCVFCGAHGFAACKCAASFKRRAPAAAMAVPTECASSAVNEERTNNCIDYAHMSPPPPPPHARTWAAYTARLFAVNQRGSFFVRWYKRTNESANGNSQLALWLRPKHPIAYQFVLGTQQQTDALCASYIRHMRLCDAFEKETRFITHSISVQQQTNLRVAPSASNTSQHNTEEGDDQQNLQQHPLHNSYSPKSAPLTHTILDVSADSLLTSPYGSPPTGAASSHASSMIAYPTSHDDHQDEDKMLPSSRSKFLSIYALPPPQQPHPPHPPQPPPDKALHAGLRAHPLLAHSPNAAMATADAVTSFYPPLRTDASQHTFQTSTTIPTTSSDAAQSDQDDNGSASATWSVSDRIHLNGSAMNIESLAQGFRARGGRRATSATKELQEYMTCDELNTPMCKICGTKFEKRGNLSRHVLAVHLKRKPFRCEQCDASFGYKTHMRRHVRTVHKKGKSFPCDLCPKELPSATHLERHKEQMHGIGSEDRKQQPQIVCPECGVSFSQRSNLTRHIASIHEKKRHVCPVCPNGSVSFGQKFDLQRHLLRRHQSESVS